MKKMTILIFCVFTTISSISQCAKRIIIYGSDSSFLNVKVTDNTSFVNSLGIGKDHFNCFAWTDNSHGSPLYNERNLFKFNLSSIDSTMLIDSARLILFPDTYISNFGGYGKPTFGTNNAATIFRNISDWDTSTLSWLNMPQTDTLYNVFVPQSKSNNQSYQLNITSLIQNWISKPSLNYGGTFRLNTENFYNSLFMNCGLGSLATQLRLEIYPHTIQPINYSNLEITASDNRFVCANVTNISPNNNNASKDDFSNYAWTNNGNGFPVYNGRSIFKFDVSNIPVGAIINDAKLYLYANPNIQFGYPASPTYGSSNASIIQQNITPFNLAALSWNNLPTVDTTNYVFIQQSNSVAENHVVDLTNFVQNWVNNPTLNNGATFRQSIENPYNCMFFYGANTSEAKKLKLKICYTTSLPLNSISFIAVKKNNSVQLEFVTKNEINVSHFNIERSFDGKSFNVINKVSAKNKEHNEYYFFDNNLSTKDEDLMLYYRVVSIDKDGKDFFTETKKVRINNSSSHFEIFPNPAKDIVTIECSKIKQLKIINYLGKEVKRYSNVFGTQIINTSHFSKGIYNIQAVMTNGDVLSKKIILE